MVWQALLLTLMGAAGTALGGLLVIIQPQMSFKRLGCLQGLAAGLMLSISLMDLLPEAAEEIGFVAANMYFYLGVAFFAAVVAIIPEPDAYISDQMLAGPHSSSAAAAKKEDPAETLQISPPTAIIAASSVRGRPALSRAASLGQDCSKAAAADDMAGALDTVQLADASRLTRRGSSCMQPQQQQAAATALPAVQLQRQQSTGGSAASTVSADLDVVLDDSDCSRGFSSHEARKLKRQLLMSGVITAIGISLHNAPEGAAIFLAAQKSPAIGISLAVAIALHNIPEGVGVALPIYFATGSRLKGLQTAVLSGLAEPLAVIFLAAFFPANMDKHIVDCMLAAVGGIMAFLAFHELMPLSIQHAGKSAAVACLFAGMGLMSFNLHLLNTYVLAGLH